LSFLILRVIALIADVKLVLTVVLRERFAEYAAVAAISAIAEAHF